MKHRIRIYLFLLISLFISCKRNIPNFQPSQEEWEQEIRKVHDGSAVFTYIQYHNLLSVLNEKNCVVLSLNDFRNYFDETKIIVGMRHDVDRHPFKALEMAKAEEQYNIKSTWYLLPTDKYYGYLDDNNTFIHINCMNNIYQQIQNLGHEIGMHNDLLTVMILWGLDPKQFNADELTYFDLLGIKMNGTTSHGSKIAKETKTGNYEIFKEFKRKDSVEYEGRKYSLGIDSLKKFGFSYEGNFTEHNKFIYDVGGKWTYIKYLSENQENRIFPETDIISDKKNASYERENDIPFERVKEIIENAVPGDRIIILTHPVWWGK